MITKEILSEAISDPIGHFEKIRKEIEKREKEVKSFITLNIDSAEKEVKEKKVGKLSYLIIS
ncbi:MAG: hypothetical protein QW367_02725, partial [Candidatus Aenigmatarchaeota archaeon]